MSTEPKWSDLASGDPARTVAAANRLLPFWVSLALVVLIGWQLANVVWTLVPGSSTGDAVSVPAGLSTSGSGGASADVQSIADASLFGKADPVEAGAVEEAPVIIDTAVATKLNLTLKGTIASNVDDQSAAIIQVGPTDDKVFVIGDTVTNGARLQAVENRRVILNENGQLTELKLPEDFKTSRPARRTTPSRQRAANPRSTPSRSIQSVVSQNAARLSDVIRPTPYFVNGQQQGYRVYPGRDRRQFAALGLKAGDLIKDIDGQSLADPQQAMQIFQALGNAQQVTVTVERNGQPETIVLKTDQLDIGEDNKDND